MLLTKTMAKLHREVEEGKARERGMVKEGVENKRFAGKLRSELRKATDDLEKLACFV